MLYYQDDQWYLDMKPLADDILNEYHSGNITIIPENAGKTFCHFLENIEPWCISRQIWWGHRMPIFKREDGSFCFTEEPGSTQIEDVFDTWFSSALWPFAILGWPDQTADLEKYYPAELIETADDILFFWCARMLMMGKFITGKLPFKTIYLHGIIRDKLGRKFSKSLGNGIDPLDIIKQYGCDALRMTLAENTMPAQDTKMNNNNFDTTKRLANKLWQASRFCLMHHDRIGLEDLAPIHPDDIKIRELYSEFSAKYHDCLKEMSFKQATIELRQFFKDTFCDWYIEAAKDRLYANDKACLATLMFILDRVLLHFHPFMPFITEKIWGSYHNERLISSQF